MPKKFAFIAGALCTLCLLCLAFSWPSHAAPPGEHTTPAPTLASTTLETMPTSAHAPALAPDVSLAELTPWEEEVAWAGKQAVIYDPAQDTITNAEKDTVLLPYTFLSRFTYLVSVERSSLSGTHNVKVYLDESNATTGNTTWRTVDSTSTTTATLAFMDGDEVYGRRLRLRVSGTGTQSSVYRLRGTLKYK